MRGLVADVGVKGVRLETFADPVIGPKEVIIRIKAAGICGSDLPMYRGIKTQDVIDAGQHIIGHEPAGVVEEIGEQVSLVKVGDRVCVYHLTGCGVCSYCQQGFYQYCLTTRRFMGFHLHGGDADLLCCDSTYAVPIPDSVGFVDAAVSACAGGTAFGALKKLGDLVGKTVVVSGLGPVGLATATLARAMGADVIGLDLIPIRLEIAKKIGCQAVIDVSKADPLTAIRDLTHGLGAPAIIECSGAPAAQNAAIQSAAIRGSVILVGHNHRLTLDPSDQLIIRREVGMIGSWIFSRADLVQLLAFLQTHNLSFEPIVSHSLPLEKASEAFELFDSGGTGKIVFVS